MMTRLLLNSFLKPVIKGAFFLFLLVLSDPSLAQTPAEAIRQAEAWIKKADACYNLITLEGDSLALIYYDRARALLENQQLKNSQLAHVYLNTGIIYYDNKKQFLTALNYYRRALQLIRQFPAPPQLYFKVYKNMHQIFTTIDQGDSVLLYHARAESLAKKYPKEIPLPFDIYNSTGLFFHQRGNYKQSLNYFSKSYYSLREKDPGDLQSLIRCGVNMNEVLAKLGRHEESAAMYHQLIKSFNAVHRKKYAFELTTIFHNLSRVHFAMRRYDSSLYWLDRSKAAYQQVEFRDPDYEMKLLINYGNVYIRLQQAQTALGYFDKSLQLGDSYPDRRMVSIANAWRGKGQAYVLQEQFGKALEAYQQAIGLLHFSFHDKNVYHNPADVSKTISPRILFEILNYKAQALEASWQQSKRLTDLTAALSTYQSTLQLADYLRRSYDSDEAKLFFASTIYPVYESALGCAFHLYELTKNTHYQHAAFRFSEYSKAAILSETVREAVIRQNAGLPADLLQKEKSLKNQITQLTTRIATAASAELPAHQQKMRELEIELGKVIGAFEKYPAYYRLKYDTSTVSPELVRQELLDDETVMVEYFMGEKHLYMFSITDDNFEMKRLAVTGDLQHQLRTFKQALQNTDPAKSYEGHAAAASLYESLIAPLQESFPGKERLLIIPDGELHYLSFDALVSRQEPLRYLLEDYAITRAYSVSFLYQTLQRKTTLTQEKSGNEVLALAPFLSLPTQTTALRAEALYRLPASGEEVKGTGGTVFSDDQATKDFFLRHYRNYNIIHLATHARADDQNPLNSYIAFYPQHQDSAASYKLYAHELYNLQLDGVKLLVLSACETGTGKLINGEGLMSLARAFSWSGCSNIVMTLWKTDDQAAAFITTQMHEYLRQGNAKDEALRKAQIDYIRQENNDYRSPNYWANFVFMGDYEPIYQNGFSPLIFVLTGCVIAGVVTAVIMWRKSKKTLTA